MTLAGKQYLVIGAGATGKAVAGYLAAQRTRVRLVEDSPEKLRQAGLRAEIEQIAGDRDANALRDVDTVVPSPGVARTHRLLRAAAERGIPILSEIELASRALSCPILAVTGTNGKSTTTVLLGEMLRQAGLEVFIGGNLGTPLIEACRPGHKWEAAVVEVSSFQLEWVVTFRPQVATILNLTPDHLDRYAGVEEYGEAKAAILRMQQPTDFAVLNRDDPWVWRQRSRTRATVVSFGEEPVEFGSFLDDEDSVVCWGPRAAPMRLSLRTALLRGRHNRENIMAAVTAASVFGIPAAAMQRAIDRTKSLPHRLELVRERNGVRFYDDSKGTNTGAVAKSVASFDANVILLLGGYDKGGDFAALAPDLRGRVRGIVFFGAAGPVIRQQLQGAMCGGIAVETAATLADAVAAAVAQARPGDTVLLSPGCASFDEFTNYVARGRRFRELVEGL
jgi:UDP-N-acetylmuramoylalanine--D-glutamate ligase